MLQKHYMFSQEMHHFFAASVCLFLFCWAAAPSIHADNNVVCPDQRSKCPEGTTCCQMPGGSYGCCPMPHAVCCSDQMHCCPADTQCDLQHQQCLNNPSSSSSGGAASSSHSHRHAQPWHRKFPASRHEEQPPPAPVQQSSDEASPSGRDGNVDLPVICPDRVHVCPAHSTCCPMDDGQRRRRQFWRRTMEDTSPTASYSCCPAEQAVCCSDHEHCCPQGSQCDLEHEACIGGSAAKSANLLRHHEQKAQHKSHHQKQQSPPASAEENDEEEAMTATARTTVPALHRCGGRGATKMGGCPLDSKCCRHRNPLDGRKSDGCCPFSNGQCCALTEHCCPQGFACDHSEGRCISEQRNGVTLSTQMFPTRMPQQLSNKHAPKVCPDGSICHHRGTCCPRQVDNEETTTAAAAGGTSQTTIIYDCCPMEKANCCPGAQVCCPHGFKCSASANKQKDGECQRMSVRELVTKLFLSDDGI